MLRTQSDANADTVRSLGPMATVLSALAAPEIAVAATGVGAIYGASLIGDYTANHPSNPFVNGPLNPFGNPYPGVRPLPPTITSPTSQPFCKPAPRAVPFYRPPTTPWPSPPANDGGQDTCMRLLTLCIDSPWQPDRRKDKWGPRKDCGACYRECRANGGAWPFYKCPI